MGKIKGWKPMFKDARFGTWENKKYGVSIQIGEGYSTYKNEVFYQLGIYKGYSEHPEYHKFTNLKDARKYAIIWMKSHPRG